MCDGLVFVVCVSSVLAVCDVCVCMCVLLCCVVLCVLSVCCVCVCVCVCACVWGVWCVLCVCECLRVCECVCVCVCLWAGAWVCVYVCVRACVRVCVCVCVSVGVQVCEYVCVCVCVVQGHTHHCGAGFLFCRLCLLLWSVASGSSYQIALQHLVRCVCVSFLDVFAMLRTLFLQCDAGKATEQNDIERNSNLL